MVSERQSFDLSGLLHLTSIDWENTQHRRSVAACLVQGVYSLERDRQEKKEGPQALAPPWWEFFHFKRFRKLVDNVDSSIFGAIYKFNRPSKGSPYYVIAFRGTLIKRGSALQDLKLDVELIRNQLFRNSRFEIAMQAVRDMVAKSGPSNVWLAGHSLGSAMAMLAGKTMAGSGNYLESFLFNPPFVSAPIEMIQDTGVKRVLWFARSVITAGLAVAKKAKQQQQQHTSQPEDEPFTTMAAWLPGLFVNPADVICREYIAYFEHRKMMEDIGAGDIERLASQNSLLRLLRRIFGKQAATDPPLHLIPSAKLTVNSTPSSDLTEAHGIQQWWRDDLQLRSEVHRYK